MGSRPHSNTIDALARHVLDSLIEGCQVVDAEFRYLYVNEVAAAHGQKTKEELLGRTMMESYPGIDATPMFERLRRCMAERVPDRMDNEFALPDGSKGLFELRFVPVPEGVCILSLDVTARQHAKETLARTTEQLQHAQKMEAVGRLAGGIAHDFNNMLSVILSYASIAIDSLTQGDPMREDMTEIERAARRSSDLVARLLAFSRQQVRQPAVIDLNDTLNKMDKMLRRVLGEDVELRTVEAPGLWPVLADPGQIEQVLVNLAVNARDAMPDGGKLTVETRNVVLDEAYAREHVGTKPGRHVMLAVSDTGIGMDAATRARVFEPFFTTKEIGKGTGLGLSTVFGIVQQSGGSIRLYSEPGRGTTFKVYLPRCAEVGEEAATRKTTPPPSPGSETILLVEDEDQVRHLVATVLERSHYRVLVVAGAEEALGLSQTHEGPIDLLLTDIVMPGLNGRQLAERLTVDRPATRVLYMSGYTDDVVVHHGVLDEGVAFLQKPITPASLLDAVRAALDTGR